MRYTYQRFAADSKMLAIEFDHGHEDIFTRCAWLNATDALNPFSLRQIIETRGFPADDTQAFNQTRNR